jgi:GNAT superfamily N-acetyltransferase
MNRTALGVQMAAVLSRSKAEDAGLVDNALSGTYGGGLPDMLSNMTVAKPKVVKPKKSLDPIAFRIDFAVSLSEHEGGPDDFITVYEGNIIGMADDDSEEKIGTLILYIVEVGRAMNERISLFDVMDCLDGDSCDCFANLFDPETEHLKPEVERLVSENRATQWDIMLIERLELVPEYRGRGLGRKVALRAIQKFGENCGIITCVPVPLQFSGLGPNDERPKGLKSAQRHVRNFWQSVGFGRIPSSDYYIWPK